MNQQFNIFENQHRLLSEGTAQNREARSGQTSVPRYLTNQSLQPPATPHRESRASPEQESSPGFVGVPSLCTA